MKQKHDINADTEPRAQEAVMTTIAHSLVGFPSPSLRVKVLRREPGIVWVMTADLLDAGTRLVLDESQIENISPESGTRHSTGLVTFI